MNSSKVWAGEHPLPDYPNNLACLLNKNADRFSNRPLFQEVKENHYVSLTWDAFRTDVVRIQNALTEQGLKQGDRVAILSPNRKEMLEIELAVMAMGAVAVPIYAGYSAHQAEPLVKFCEPTFVVVADQTQFSKLDRPEDFKLVIHFDPLENISSKNIKSLTELIGSSKASGRICGEEMSSDSVCLMMYTSGTMDKPKCVQLTHGNILSQQAAMHVLWKLDCDDRFLTYLPWHHSFGGIYEKYAALYNGAVLSLDSGNGKNIDLLLENWKLIKPTVFFSVPRVYQQIITQVMQNPDLEKEVFHDNLRFIFTAAAPLPKSISDIFESRNIPVYEGWGLTETSPCCTVTDPKVDRKAGVVGKPISGVSLKLADDGEILVSGPNVMKGYYHNPDATDKVFSDDGWFATGDVGEFTDEGLRLISRKDRIFKLSNAEKVIPTEIEKLIVNDCCYISHAFITGSGKDYPVVLLFPNSAMLKEKPDPSRLKPDCKCPHGLKSLSTCLNHCLRELNQTIDAKFSRPRAAMLIDHELSIENEELTPSMKLAPNVVGRIFKGNIELLYGEADDNTPEQVYVLDLEP